MASIFIRFKTVASGAPVTHVADCERLPADVFEKIAAKLKTRDLIAVSQVSRSWRQAAVPNWEAAYGPKPCHRAANTPAQWRTAVQEKVNIEDRLLAPFRGVFPSPEQLEKEAMRLRWNEPLAALVALRLADPSDDYIPGILLDELWTQGREDELLTYAEARLQQDPRGARELLSWAYHHHHLPVLRLAQRARAQPHGRHFSPIIAAQNNQVDVLHYMRDEEPKSAGRHAWRVALVAALRTHRLDTAREVAACLQAGVGAVEPGPPCRDGLALNLSDLPDDALDEAIRLLAAAGVPLSSVLHATLGGSPDRALHALRRLRDLAYNHVQWRVDLATSIQDSLGWLKETDLPVRLRAFFALGGDFPAIAQGINGTGWFSAIELAQIVAAGVPPTAQVGGVPLLEKVWALVRNDAREAEEALTILANHGAQLPEGEVETATELLARSHLSAPLLRVLLKMGYPADNEETLLECVSTHNLEALRALAEAGANLFRYDDEFLTLIDHATDPAMVAYLRERGLRPFKPKSRNARPGYAFLSLRGI